jgi:hypothetical protein
MKESNHSPESRPQASDDLQIWKVEAKIPRRFQADVWQKIAARQAKKNLWSRFVEWTAPIVVRPQFAAALILISGVTGGGLAQWKVQQVNAQSFKTLESRYMASIDPYAHLASEAESRMQ